MVIVRFRPQDLRVAGSLWIHPFYGLFITYSPGVWQSPPRSSVRPGMILLRVPYPGPSQRTSLRNSGGLPPSRETHEWTWDIGSMFRHYLEPAIFVGGGGIGPPKLP